MKEIPFNISARAARLIGQENFANAEGAIIELVKNSYDADATVSLVFFCESDNSLFIVDDGDGMTEDIILKHWMTIGTDNKNNNLATRKSRIKTGAKGIGRFALDRLGVECELITKTTESQAISWKVSWSQFDGAGKSLSDVKATLEELPNIDFKERVANDLASLELPEDFFSKHFLNNSGTIIKINSLRDKWIEPNISLLFQNLEILIPPLETSSFAIYVYYSTLLDRYGQIKPAPFDDYDYKLSAQITTDKNVKVTVLRNELLIDSLKDRNFFENSTLKGELYEQAVFENGNFIINTTLEKLVPGFKGIDRSNQLNKIGPFDFTFYFLKRGGGQERDENDRVFPYRPFNYSTRVQLLDRYGGIKIFRDNFRVRPYGEPKSSAFDWLDLGIRAAQSPTVTKLGYRVRPNQVYGIITISRVNNPAFQDKSNREGLQENETFSVFKQLLTAIIAIFENDRNQIMMAVKKLHEEQNQNEIAKSTVSDEITRFKEASIKRKQIGQAETLPKSVTKPSTDSKSDENLLDHATNVINTSEVAINALKEDINDLLYEQKLLRVLASTGLTVTAFAHELKNLSGVLIPRTNNLKEVLENLIDKNSLEGIPDFLNPFVMIGDIQSDDQRINQWLDFSLSALRKDKRKRKKIDMVDYLERLKRTWGRLLDLKGIKLTINKKQFVTVYYTAFEIDLDGIFGNLITNSVEAFSRPEASEEREILFSFSFSPLSGISILYEDTGPGLSQEITDPTMILQPHFSTKRDPYTGEVIGTGLGMWLVKSTIDEYKGSLEVIPSRPGFKIKILLPT